MSVWQDLREEVRGAVSQALVGMGVEGEFEVETPSAEIADFAVPCFPFAKVMRKAPKVIASEMAAAIAPQGSIVEVWDLNGYLNFRIDEDHLVRSTLQEIVGRELDYGRSESKGLKVNLEHTSVNPTGPIHVGRARNPIIGDTLARCMRMAGYDVETEYYVNDVGKQVVLLTWGIENIDPSTVKEDDNPKVDHRLVHFYRAANRMLESDPEVAAAIADMLRRFEAGDAEVIAKVRRTAEMMIGGIKESLESINVSLDNFAWESQFIADGSAHAVVERLKGSEFSAEEDGACYLDLEEFGVHGKNTKFFYTRSDGTTLYTTRDMAYHLDKFKRADMVIDVLGEDQKLGNQQLRIALEILGEERMPQPMFYAFVSLPEGKMSTRRGTVVHLDDLIEEAEERAYHEVKVRRDDLDEERMRTIARTIGRGAIRYNIVRVQPEKQLVFKWEEALNFDGNSAPFLQYSHARACSILRKAGDFTRKVDESLLTDPYERRLVRVLARFPDVVEECGERWRIQAMPAYGHEVASTFNQFYASVPVLNSGERREARLTLVESTLWVLRGVLMSLGLGAPEEM